MAEWIRERLAQGEPPADIVADLVAADWPEGEAQTMVWKEIGAAVTRDERSRLWTVLPMMLSALALVAVTVMAVVMFTGPALSVEDPVGDGATGNNNQSVVTERVFGIPGGTLPKIEDGPAPMVLRVTNRDSQLYTLTIGSDSYTLPADGGAARIRLETAGTYTLEITETGARTSFTVE